MYHVRPETRKPTELMQFILLVSLLWYTTVNNYCFAVEAVKTVEVIEDLKEVEIIKDIDAIEGVNEEQKVKDADVVEIVEDLQDINTIDLADVIEVVDDVEKVEIIKAPGNAGNNDDTVRSVKIIELPNGSLYSGDIKYEVIRDGKGINEWPNGDRYKGEWLNDSPHGRGLMFRKDKEEYSGQFAFGQYSGVGDLKSTKGERYTGSFRFNLLDGLGLFTSSNSEYYLGEFSQQKRHGRFLYFKSLSSKPEYQIWFNDTLEKVIEMSDTQDVRNIRERELITQMIERFTKIGKKRLSERRSNTHYQIRGRVRKIVSDVENTPEHAYGDLIINLLNLS